MHSKIKEIAGRIPKEHQDLVLFSQHILNAIDKMAIEHLKQTNINSLSGIKLNLEEEALYYSQIREMKKVVLLELEKTADDFSHLGDKRWIKHYKDGVN